MNVNEIRNLIIAARLIDEVFRIVFKDYPEIINRALENIADKNPETFKEIFEEMRSKKNAEVKN